MTVVEIVFKLVDLNKLYLLRTFCAKMYFSNIIVICLLVLLPLIAALPIPNDTRQIALSWNAVGTEEDAENVRFT